MTKPKKKNLNFDLGLILLITGALANTTLWIGAFVSTEAAGPIGVWVRAVLLPVLGGISGLSMGFTATFGLVYVLARLNHLKPIMDQKVKGTKKKYKTIPNPRFYTAWGSLLLLLIISPVLLGPYVIMLLTGKESVYAVLGDLWVKPWSVFRVLAADLALGAVAMVYGVQLHAIGTSGRTSKPATTPSQSNASPARTPKGATQSVASPKPGATTPSNLRPCDVPGCGIPYKWPNGKGAHFKKYHKDLVIRKGIPAQVSLPIKPGEKHQ